MDSKPQDTPAQNSQEKTLEELEQDLTIIKNAWKILSAPKKSLSFFKLILYAFDVIEPFAKEKEAQKQFEQKLKEYDVSIDTGEEKPSSREEAINKMRPIVHSWIGQIQSQIAAKKVQSDPLPTQVTGTGWMIHRLRRSLLGSCSASEGNSDHVRKKV